MKIVFLSYLHGLGGAQRQNVMLANEMVKRGHDITLISISSNNNCYFLDKRVVYLFLPDRKTNIFRVVTRFIDIRKQLSIIRPDITVNFWFQSAYLTAMMSKKITGKVVFSERSDPSIKKYHGVLGLIRKLTLPRIDGFVFQSKGAQRYFNKSVQARSNVIPNPVYIQPEDYPVVIARRKVIVNVGRLHPQKNQKLLIDAFALISDQISEYSLEIFGSGELEQQLKTQIKNLGLENRIYLKGTSENLHSLIYDASLFVLSSDYEGIPNALLEAMALGIPCISTDCRPGGAREIIDDGKNGLIVPVNNEKELGNAMLKILRNKSFAEDLGKQAKTDMNRFQYQKIYDLWEKTFEQIQNGSL